MLSSGNGRHRRPRQAPAAMVTVAATGAGLALPLLGAGAAHAAEPGTWDKVAVCETGGLWSADAGNGFYGGLAITQDTWDIYGGRAYAPRPDLASKTEQIAVAEKMLTDLGPDAWPGCEEGTGLLAAVTPPVTLPGSTPTATTPGTPAPTASGTPTAPADPTSGSTSGSNTDPSLPTILPTAPVTPTAPTPPVTGTPGEPSAPTTPTTPPAPTTSAPPVSGTPGPSGTPSATATPTTPGTGRHAKPYVPTDAELAAADQATRTEITAVTDPGSATTGTTTGTTGTGSGAAGSAGHTTDSVHDYTVGDGDSLSGIASSHHVQGGWSGLYDANRQVIGEDPNLIKPGQILSLDLN